MSTDEKIRHTAGRIGTDFAVWESDPPYKGRFDIDEGDVIDAEFYRFVITAPHSCDVEGCPGQENLEKLQAYAKSAVRFSDITLPELVSTNIALQEENERLRKNYEVLNAKWAEDDERVEYAEATNAALVEALRKYGVHQPGCWLAAPQRRRPANEHCSCGLDEAKRKAEARP